MKKKPQTAQKNHSRPFPVMEEEGTLPFDVLRHIHKACDFKTRRLFQKALGWGTEQLPFRPILYPEVETFLLYSRRHHEITIEKTRYATLHRFYWGGQVNSLTKKPKYRHFLEISGDLQWQKDGQSKWKVPTIHHWGPGVWIYEHMESWSEEESKYHILFHGYHVSSPTWNVIESLYTRAIPKRYTDGKPIRMNDEKSSLPSLTWLEEIEVDLFYFCTKCKVTFIGKFFGNPDADIGNQIIPGPCVVLDGTSNVEKIIYDPEDEGKKGRHIRFHGPFRNKPLGFSCVHDD